MRHGREFLELLQCVRPYGDYWWRYKLGKQGMVLHCWIARDGRFFVQAHLHPLGIKYRMCFADASAAVVKMAELVFAFISSEPVF